MIAILVCLAFLAFILYMKKQNNKKDLIALGKKLPGPRSWPIIGNILLFAVPQKDILMTFNKNYIKYNSPTRYWLGGRLYIGIDKPEHIEATLTSSIAADKGDEYKFIVDCIGFGLIQSNGNLHRLHRKLMTLPLRGQVLELQMSKFNSKSQICAESLEENVNKGMFDVVKYIEKCSMALVCEVILGIEMDNSDPQNEQLIKIISGLYKSISERQYKIWLHPYVTYRLSSHYKFQKEGIKLFNNFLQNKIDLKKKELVRNENVGVKEYDSNYTSLEWLLRATDSKNNLIFSENEIIEEITTLFTASEDTTMTVTSFALLMLAIHKNIQEEVWLEQVSVFGHGGDPSLPIEAHQLKEMKYLHMVIQEVLRMFPVAPLMTRKVKEDFQLGDINLPKDTHILINIYFAHRNEKIWPEPDKFDPLRFTSEEKAKRSPYSYIPFSGGLRGCIGKEFAFMAIKSLLSYIVRNYTIDTQWTMEDIILETDISVRSTNGYKIEIMKRAQCK